MKYFVLLTFTASIISVISKEDVNHRIHNIFKKPILFPKRSSEKRAYSCCNLPSGDRGACVPILNCPVVQSWIHKRVVQHFDIHCSGSRKGNQFVCCPPEAIRKMPDKKFDLCKPKYTFKECGSPFIYMEDLKRIYSMNETAEQYKKEGFTVVPTEVDVDKLLSFKVFNKIYAFKPPEADVNQAVGGKNARRVVTSYLALLGTRGRRNIRWFCGGVIINRDWILTAAHCAQQIMEDGNFDYLKRETTVVRLGEYDFSNEDITADEYPLDFGILEVKLYPEYEHPLVYHDLALIKLNKSIPYHRPDMRPVCLPWEQEADRNLVGMQVTLTGWGSVFAYSGELSPKAQEVNVTVFDTSICDRTYSTLEDFNSKFPLGIYSDTMMCAGDKQGGKDACMGDSGGPIVYQDRSGKFTLAGVVSSGYGCGLDTYPGMYIPTNKAKYLSWIKQTAFSK